MINIVLSIESILLPDNL